MENKEASLSVNFSHFEFLTMHTGQYASFISACETEDDIGVVLRIHLLLEKDLEAWSACSSQNGKFFAGFGESLNLDFAAKNQLAHNFGLSEDLYKAVKRINKIRNIRAHQIDKFALTESEIESLSALLESNYPSNLLKINAFSAQINQGEIYELTSKATPLRIKFLMLYSVLKMRMCDEAKRQIGSKL